MRIDEIIEKAMIVFACLPIYWFLKLGYWAWFDPQKIEKMYKPFRKYPPGIPTIYFDPNHEVKNLRTIFVLICGILLAIGLLTISSLIMEKIQ